MKRPIVALLMQNFGNVLNKKQTVTIRAGKRDYRAGDILMICCPVQNKCVSAEITLCEHFKLKDVPDFLYKKDNYNSVEEMFNDLKSYYPDITLESEVTCIQWNHLSGSMYEEYKRITEDKWQHLPDDGKYIVRLYDGFDNLWINITDAVSKQEAIDVWNEHTNMGTEKTSFNNIDYYSIFPADTKMVFS